MNEKDRKSVNMMYNQIMNNLGRLYRYATDDQKDGLARVEKELYEIGLLNEEDDDDR